MHVALRRATPADAPGLLALYRELRPHDPPLATAEARALIARMAADDHLHLLVAECDDALAATCYLALVPNLGSGGRPFAVIEHVITGARFRRRGLARELMLHALDLAWGHACCKVLLLSGAQRSEAHAFYETLGFRGDVERGFVAKPPAAVQHSPRLEPT